MDLGGARTRRERAQRAQASAPSTRARPEHAWGWAAKSSAPRTTPAAWTPSRSPAACWTMTTHPAPRAAPARPATSAVLTAPTSPSATTASSRQAPRGGDVTGSVTWHYNNDFNKISETVTGQTGPSFAVFGYDQLLTCASPVDCASTSATNALRLTRSPQHGMVTEKGLAENRPCVRSHRYIRGHPTSPGASSPAASAFWTDRPRTFRHQRPEREAVAPRTLTRGCGGASARTCSPRCSHR
jgi:hypothetical protein